ncbi:MAG: hypothetical protein FWG20_06660 [Candidatus Cloacimonetes bacterium]|nr:hypothetical protein [Candidatus Cloacimonadota bacterium]
MFKAVVMESGTLSATIFFSVWMDIAAHRYCIFHILHILRIRHIIHIGVESGTLSATIVRNPSAVILSEAKNPEIPIQFGGVAFWSLRKNDGVVKVDVNDMSASQNVEDV